MTEPKKTLRPEDVSSERVFGRRSALARIGATVMGAAAVAAAPWVAAEAQQQPPGPGGERRTPSPPDEGEGRRTGRTDGDSGPNADRAGQGRSRCSDSDSGPNADPAGAGRRC